MSPRWNWDFEDEKRPAADRPAPPPPEAASGSEQRAWVHRRRRLAAAVVVVAVASAAVAAALSGSHRQASGSAPAPRAGPQLPHPSSAGAVDGVSHEERKAVNSVLSYTPFVRQGGTRGHDVALTFDDGPGPYTPGVLDVLERHHAAATFFAIGRMERYFGASTARQIRNGDAVGDHTENHRDLARLTRHEVREELFEPLARIELLGGARPRLFRPPYGSFNALTMRELHALHLLMVLWSVDTGDYLDPGVATIVARALEGARPGAIILMHDGGGDRSQTVAALPAVIERLRARGFHLVTVPRLLLDDPPPHGERMPTSLKGD
ncbi:MAG: polysaccharide deacetylase family protein [Actinobacteria bacterium]|nr:MAG: polysaccharide deacetylase family protein [Actinomycetota bacterium]